MSILYNTEHTKLAVKYMIEDIQLEYLDTDYDFTADGLRDDFLSPERDICTAEAEAVMVSAKAGLIDWAIVANEVYAYFNT